MNGDTLNVARPTLAALRFRLADLESEREVIVLSSSRAFTSGAMRRLSDEIINVRGEIARREREA